MEITDEEAARIEAEEAAKKSGKTEDAPMEEKKDEENKGQKPNAGNGGTTELYSWE